MSAIQYAGAIVLVFSLLFLLIGVMQRRGMAQFKLPFAGKSAARNMEVMERLPLTAQHSLHLVRVRGEVLLVGVSPSGCSVLRNSGPEGSEGRL